LIQLEHEHRAARDLLALVDMVNQAVGDALSGLLLVEAALRRLELGLSAWADLYRNLPSRQLKVPCFPLLLATGSAFPQA
jgi:phosphoacetylglucosamine mutase